MTAWSCSGMQRNPPLVLGLFILTLLLLMGCGSGTSTGAPGPPYVSPDPSRSPRRLKRKVELRSAQLRMDPVSAGEGVSQTDLLSIGLEHAASVFPSSQLPSSIPARMRREERSVEVPQSPLPFRKRRRCPGASGEFRSRGGRHALSPQALEREPSPPPPAAVSAPPALPSWEPLLAAPPPSPQQVQSVAIPVSLPETPSTPQQPALMPSHPPVHPLALRMTARGPTPMQLLGRPVATLAAAAVPARPLVPQGQQSPQQPPVLLIFPHQESPLPPTPVATHPPVEPIPGTPQPPQNQPAHLTGQVPQSGGSMESIVNSTTAHSTLNADVVSTCVLALQNALHQIQCRTQTQTSTLQTQSPVQNTLSTQVAEPQNLGGKTGQIPQQQPTLSTTQKPPTDVVIQHNAEGSLMLTLSRGAVLPASGPPTSSVSPTTSILLQIELPMGTPPSGDAPNPSLLLRSPQIQSAPTTHATTRLQEVWLKEPLVESKPALRSTFQRLNHHREHMDRRLQRQTAPDAQPQEEEQGESTAPGGEGGERPLRRCSSNPERLDVRWKTERISDAVAPDAQDAPRRRRDSVKRRSNRKVDVESDFIPRAKRPRHRIEVPDTFFPLASQLAGLVTTSQLTTYREPMHVSKSSIRKVSKSSGSFSYGAAVSGTNSKPIPSSNADTTYVTSKTIYGTKSSQRVSDMTGNCSNPATSYFTVSQTTHSSTSQNVRESVKDIIIPFSNYAKPRTTTDVTNSFITRGFAARMASTPTNEVTSQTTDIRTATMEIYRNFTTPTTWSYFNFESSKSPEHESTPKSTPLTVRIITITERKFISPLTVSSPLTIPEPENDKVRSEPETLLKTAGEYFDRLSADQIDTENQITTEPVSTYITKTNENAQNWNRTKLLPSLEVFGATLSYLRSEGILGTVTTPSILSIQGNSKMDTFSPAKVFPTTHMSSSKEDLTKEVSYVSTLGDRSWTRRRLSEEDSAYLSTKNDKEWLAIPLNIIHGNKYGNEFIEKRRFISDRRWHSSLRDFNWDKLVHGAGCAAVCESPLDAGLSDLQHKGRLENIPQRVSTMIPRTRLSNSSRNNARPQGEDIDESDPSDNLPNRLDTVAVKTVMKMEEEERKDYDSADDEAEWVPLPVLSTVYSIIAGDNVCSTHVGSESSSANNEHVQERLSGLRRGVRQFQPKNDASIIKREDIPKKWLTSIHPHIYTVCTEKTTPHSTTTMSEPFSTNTLSIVLAGLETNSDRMSAVVDGDQPAQGTSSTQCDLLHQLRVSLPNYENDMTEMHVYESNTPSLSDLKIDADASSQSIFLEHLHGVPLLRDNTFVNLIPNGSLLFPTPKQNSSSETRDSISKNELLADNGIPNNRSKETELGDIPIKILGLLPFDNLTYSRPTKSYISVLSIDSTMKPYAPTTEYISTSKPLNVTTQGDMNYCGCHCSQGKKSVSNVLSSVSPLESSKSTSRSITTRTLNNSETNTVYNADAPFRYSKNLSLKHTRRATKSSPKSRHRKRRSTIANAIHHVDPGYSFSHTKKFLHPFKSIHSSPRSIVSHPATNVVSFGLTFTVNRSPPESVTVNESDWENNSSSHVLSTSYREALAHHPETTHRAHALFQHHGEPANPPWGTVTKSTAPDEDNPDNAVTTASFLIKLSLNNSTMFHERNSSNDSGTSGTSTKSKHWQLFRHHSPFLPFTVTSKLRSSTSALVLPTRRKFSSLHATPIIFSGTPQHSKGFRFLKKSTHPKAQDRGNAPPPSVVDIGEEITSTSAPINVAQSSKPTHPTFASRATTFPPDTLATPNTSKSSEETASRSNVIFISRHQQNTSFFDAVQYFNLSETTESPLMETTSPLMFTTKALLGFPNIVFNERDEDESQLHSDKEKLSGNVDAGNILPPSWSTSALPGNGEWRAIAQEAEELATLNLLGQASSAANTGESPLSPFEHVLPVPVIRGWEHGPSAEPILHEEEFGSKEHVAPRRGDNAPNIREFNNAYSARAKQAFNNVNSDLFSHASTFTEKNPPLQSLNIDELIRSFKYSAPSLLQSSSMGPSENQLYADSENKMWSLLHNESLLQKKPNKISDTKNIFEYRKQSALLQEPEKSTQPSIVNPVRKLLFNEESFSNNINLVGGRVKLGSMCDPAQELTCVCVLGEALTYLNEAADLDPGGWWRTLKSLPCPSWRKLPTVLEADRNQYSSFYASSLYGGKGGAFAEHSVFTRYGKPVRKTWSKMHHGLHRVPFFEESTSSDPLKDNEKRTWALQGASVHLPCPVAANASSRGAKAPEFLWWRGGNMVSRWRFNASAAPPAPATSGANVSLASAAGVGTLQLEHVSVTDAGDYRCEVHWDSSGGNALQLTGNHHLEVFQVPYVIFRAEVRYSVDSDTNQDIARFKRQNNDEYDSYKQEEETENGEEEEQEEKSEQINPDETTHEEETDEGSGESKDSGSTYKERGEDGADKKDYDESNPHFRGRKTQKEEEEEEEENEEGDREKLPSRVEENEPAIDNQDVEENKGSHVYKERTDSVESKDDYESMTRKYKATPVWKKGAWGVHHKQLGWIKKPSDTTIVHKHFGPILVEVERSTIGDDEDETDGVTEEVSAIKTNAEIIAINDIVTDEVTKEVTETYFDTTTRLKQQRFSSSKECTQEDVELLVDLAGPLLGEAACGPTGICRAHMTRASCQKEVPSSANEMDTDENGKVLKSGAHRAVDAGRSKDGEGCNLQPGGRRYEVSPKFSAVIRIARQVDTDGFLKATAEFRLSPLERRLGALNVSACGTECHLHAQKLFTDLVQEHNLQAALSVPLILKGMSRQVRLLPMDYPSPHIEFRCPGGFHLHYEVCLPCPPNSFSQDDSDDCFECPVGTYQPKSGSDECIPCCNPFISVKCLSLLYKHFGWFLLSMAVLVSVVAGLVYCCSAVVLSRRARGWCDDKRESGKCVNVCARGRQTSRKKKRRCSQLWRRCATPPRCVEGAGRRICGPEQNFQVVDILVGRQESLEEISETTDMVVDSQEEDDEEDDDDEGNDDGESDDDVVDERLMEAKNIMELMGEGDSRLEGDQEMEAGEGHGPTSTDLRRWSGRSSERQPLLPRIDEIDEGPCGDPGAWRGTFRAEIALTPTFSLTSLSSRGESTRTPSVRSYCSTDEEQQRKTEKPNVPSPDFSLLSDDVPRCGQTYVTY